MSRNWEKYESNFKKSLSQIRTSLRQIWVIFELRLGQVWVWTMFKSRLIVKTSLGLLWTKFHSNLISFIKFVWGKLTPTFLVKFDNSLSRNLSLILCKFEPVSLNQIWTKIEFNLNCIWQKSHRYETEIELLFKSPFISSNAATIRSILYDYLWLFGLLIGWLDGWLVGWMRSTILGILIVR